MASFRKIDGAFAITRSYGVYKQVDVYERNGFIYVKHGGGFVSIDVRGGTSVDRLRLDELSIEIDLAASKLGRICLKGHPSIPDQIELASDNYFLKNAELLKIT